MREEISLFEKIEKRGEILVGLSGKSCNDRRAHRDALDALSRMGEQIEEAARVA